LNIFRESIGSFIESLKNQRSENDPKASGEGVRVALIDTGVNRQILSNFHRDLSNPINEICGVRFLDHAEFPMPDNGKESSPHGTTVADIILRLAPDVQLYSADIFGTRGSCTIQVLYRAIKWAIEEFKVKVINLSLGVPESQVSSFQIKHELQRAIEQAYSRDIIIVAAAHNDHPHIKSIPSVLSPYLLSVDKKDTNDPFYWIYRLCHLIEFQARSQGYLGPFSSEPTTSWAAAHLTGIVCRFLSLYPEMKPFEIKTILYWLSTV